MTEQTLKVEHVIDGDDYEDTHATVASILRAAFPDGPLAPKEKDARMNVDPSVRSSWGPLKGIAVIGINVTYKDSHFRTVTRHIPIRKDGTISIDRVRSAVLAAVAAADDSARTRRARYDYDERLRAASNEFMREFGFGYYDRNFTYVPGKHDNATLRLRILEPEPQFDLTLNLLTRGQVRDVLAALACKHPQLRPSHVGKAYTEICPNCGVIPEG